LYFGASLDFDAFSCILVPVLILLPAFDANKTKQRQCWEGI
jgi:hypothetical protein